MKISVIGVIHETNTFAPGITEIRDFTHEWVTGNESFLYRYTGTRTSMGGVVDEVKDAGAELAAGFYTSAVPSGMVTAETADTLLDVLINSIDTTADGVVAILHGAMVSENYLDFEGELLRRIRNKVGVYVPVALTLDLHATITPLMIDHVEIVVGYDTYPHVDAYERAREATQLLIHTIKGNIKPVRALKYPQMLIVPQTMMTEEDGTFKDIMERAFAIERDPRVLSITVAGGFPYSDVPDAGMAFIVTTDDDQALADQYADELCQMAWNSREQLTHLDTPVVEAISKAMALTEGPVILVEGSDNVGGGGPGDATHTLQHLVDASKTCLIVIRDENAVLEAHRLGVGAIFESEIGGKSDTLHGDPVHIRGTIRLLSDGNYKHIGEYMTGQWATMGKTAVIEAGNLTIVMTEKRVGPWDPNHIGSVGLRPEDFHIIVVKAAVAWKTAFGSVCRHTIYLDTPGCCSANLQHFNYKHIKRPIYPLDSVL